MFAIVKIAGKQYKVQKDAVIEVDRIEGNVGDTLTFTDVLLKAVGDKVTVGEPTVPGAKVEAKLLAQIKGDKVEVRRYKSKVRYRRANGVRPYFSRLEITQVS